MKIVRRPPSLRILVVEPEPTDESSRGAVLVFCDDTLVAGMVLVRPRNRTETFLYPADELDPDLEPWIVDAVIEQVAALKARLGRSP